MTTVEFADGPGRDRVRPDPALSSPAPGRAGLLGLQRAAGNAATAGLVRRVVQRDPPAGGAAPALSPTGGLFLVPIELPPLPDAVSGAESAGSGAADVGPGGPGAPAAGAAPAAPSAPSAPAGGPAPGGAAAPHAAAAADGPRLGIDVTVGGAANLAALDRSNTGDPSTPRAHPMARWGFRPSVGDISGGFGVIAVCRDCNVHSTPGHWNIGHEVQGQLGANPPAMSGAPWFVTATVGIDVLHKQFDTALGQLDWHALVAQVYANAGLDPSLVLGGGIGTGVELHPGRQNRFSITAMILTSANDTMAASGAGGSGSLSFNLGLTLNAHHP